MTGMKINRRTFIGNAALGAIGLPLIMKSTGKAAPSDRVRVAHIGLGGQGNAHMGWFNALPDVEIAALCDVDKVRLENTAAKLKKMNQDAKPDLYSDFRKVLERKDIDAISCATPDHWHALIAMSAFNAGKDVYGEKPLTYSVAEGRAMLKCLEKTKSVFQLGTQIHATDNYHRVAELVKSGKLGKIHTVRLWKTGGSPGLGFPQIRSRLKRSTGTCGWAPLPTMNILRCVVMEVTVTFLIIQGEFLPISGVI
jgi:predicted dehydrogenase